MSNTLDEKNLSDAELMAYFLEFENQAAVASQNVQVLRAEMNRRREELRKSQEPIPENETDDISD